jgi:chloramphenicol 3-O phosphotransferase
MSSTAPGRIVILNGVPRAGKSSIAAAIQERFNGVWMNIGLDHFKAMTPQRYQPGIGLRPGGERPDLEPLIATLYLGLYEAIAAHSRLGVNVVADVGHHDGYSTSLGILPNCAARLRGLPAWLVGVRCPIEVVMERRAATWGKSYAADGSIPDPVLRFQRLVHVPGMYDLEVDTSQLSPAECADAIGTHLQTGPAPTVLEALASTARQASSDGG